MSIRALIAALVLWAVLALAALGGIAGYALWQSGYLAQRVAGVHERLVTLAAIDGAANQYGENVAMVLLLNRNGLDFLSASRVAMERNFARLSQVTRDEIGSLAGVGDVTGELPELDNTRRMTELYHAIDRSTARMLIQLREGQQADARELFNLDIAFRLSNELQPLIDSELDGEREEVDELTADAAAAQQNLVLGAGITGGVAVVGFLLIGLLAWQAVHRMDAAALAGAAAQDQAVREAERRLGALEMRRAQFLADISHELRTPVTILRGEAEVGLRGTPRPEELRDTLERVQAQATELGELLEDLITYARAGSEDQEFRPAVVAVAELVTAAAGEGASLGEPREVTVATALDDSGATIEGDVRRLKRVLLIGIDNAVKHSAPGSTVTIRTRRDAGSVVIEVVDEGPGLLDEEKPKVFDRFFRGRGERELHNRGIGIGLAIAREIVELHRGRISLDNRPEGGAVLTVTLPLREAAP
jgi:signal transduction histidine kinase